MISKSCLFFEFILIVSKCSACGKKNAKSTLRIAYAPNVLVIVLKRFSFKYGDEFGSKDSTHVDAPMVLDIQNSFQVSSQYELRASVVRPSPFYLVSDELVPHWWTWVWSLRD